MKKKYETPFVEVVEFDVKDIITTSGEELGSIDPDLNNGGNDWSDFF